MIRSDEIDGHLPLYESWRTSLGVMEDETILFKTKLARILSENFERKHLAHLEVFQYRFLKMDEQISVLRHEVRDLQEVMQHSCDKNSRLRNVTVMMQFLAARMELVEETFKTLATDFHVYLQENFSS